HTRFSRDWSSDVCSSDLSPSEQPFLLVALAAGQHQPTHSLANHHLFHLLAQHRHMLAQFVEVPQDRFKLELGVDVVVWLVVHDTPWAFSSRHCCDASM